MLVVWNMTILNLIKMINAVRWWNCANIMVWWYRKNSNAAKSIHIICYNTKWNNWNMYIVERYRFEYFVLISYVMTAEILFDVKFWTLHNFRIYVSLAHKLSSLRIFSHMDVFCIFSEYIWRKGQWNVIEDLEVCAWNVLISIYTLW